MIAVSRGNNVQYFELDLSGTGQLAAHSFDKKIFQSRPAEDMDSEEKELMFEFNRQVDNLKCKIGIFDLHRIIWTTEEQGCKYDSADLEGLRGALKPS